MAPIGDIWTHHKQQLRLTSNRLNDFVDFSHWLHIRGLVYRDIVQLCPVPLSMLDYIDFKCNFYAPILVRLLRPKWGHNLNLVFHFPNLVHCTIWFSWSSFLTDFLVTEPSEYLSCSSIMKFFGMSFSFDCSPRESYLALARIWTYTVDLANFRCKYLKLQALTWTWKD